MEASIPTLRGRSQARERAVFGCVVGLAFVLQFFASLLQPRPDYFWMTDSPAYWANASAFYNTGRIPNLFFPMGTSLFLAPFAGAGVRPFAVVLWVHPLLHAMNAAAAYWIVRSARSVTPAAVAAMAIAIYPPLLNYSRQLISEPWFVTTLMLGLCMLMQPGCTCALLGGGMLGAATLVRTPGLGIAAVMPMALLALWRPKTQVLGFVAGFGIVLGIGVTISSLSAGRAVFLTSGVSMTTGCRSVFGGYEFLPVEERPDSYLTHLIQEPSAFLEERAFAFLNIVSPWPLDSSRSIATKVIIFFSDAPILLGALASVGVWVRRRKLDASLLLLIPAIGLIGFYTLLFAINRYRMPYMPPLICLAVWTLWPRTPPFSDEESLRPGEKGVLAPSKVG